MNAIAATNESHIDHGLSIIHRWYGLQNIARTLIIAVANSWTLLLHERKILVGKTIEGKFDNSQQAKVVVGANLQNGIDLPNENHLYFPRSFTDEFIFLNKSATEIHKIQRTNTC